MQFMRTIASIPLSWRTPKVILALFIIELPFTIAALALFGIADPNLYRTLLWQEGSDHGWNSNPNEILYAFANYRPIPVPIPWAQFITTWNVVVAVLSMFILLVKVPLFILAVFPPILSILIHALLIAIYAVSIYYQAGSDMSDPDHPSKVPWYLTRSCGPPVSAKAQGYCMQAKGAFAVTVCLCALFVVYLVLSIISLRPARKERNSKLSLDEEESPTSPENPPNKAWEMSHLQPMTPRTLAFNTLDGSVPQGKGKKNVKTNPLSLQSQMEQKRKSNRELPLRHHIAMGRDTYKGKEPA